MTFFGYSRRARPARGSAPAHGHLPGTCFWWRFDVAIFVLRNNGAGRPGRESVMAARARGVGPNAFARLTGDDEERKCLISSVSSRSQDFSRRCLNCITKWRVSGSPSTSLWMPKPRITSRRSHVQLKILFLGVFSAAANERPAQTRRR